MVYAWRGTDAGLVDQRFDLLKRREADHFKHRTTKLYIIHRVLFDYETFSKSQLVKR